MENNYWYLVGGCKGDCELDFVGLLQHQTSREFQRGDVLKVEKCKKCGLHWQKKIGVYSEGSAE